MNTAVVSVAALTFGDLTLFDVVVLSTDVEDAVGFVLGDLTGEKVDFGESSTGVSAAGTIQLYLVDEDDEALAAAELEAVDLIEEEISLYPPPEPPQVWTVNLAVMDALADAAAPVAFQHYAGGEDTYITFFTYNEQPEQHADDAERSVGHYVQVDVWSKDDYTSLVDDVQQRMAAAGFRRINSHDLYEDDLQVYHKAMRFVLGTLAT